ncbi:unnamed protein product [Penicillium salamii]|uniref:Uncharacterized protein n=1 Tax=Penicillium salamii TaxID=1612424 RepID=A0A9W4NRE5_9EURO|nr:unnamed protein product [Penicillium salamii]CAG8104229.1 unnamed protein product [Penicillium salamii]CAG8138489.1 unnamed protein product [Penicillium salamii]CAG8144019.1 unnamed protein product [Penicillium salamii]CAG8179291.1 unnamed protein product [Penicillium salamii]
MLGVAGTPPLRRHDLPIDLSGSCPLGPSQLKDAKAEADKQVGPNDLF